MYGLERSIKYYGLPFELSLYIAESHDRKGEPPKKSSVDTYSYQAKANMLNILKNATVVRCSENKCSCRILLPLKGYTFDEKPAIQESRDLLQEVVLQSYCPGDGDAVGTISLRDPISKPEESNSLLMITHEEELDVFRMSHAGGGHASVSKASLNTVGIKSVDGDLYTVYIDERTKKYVSYVKSCD